MPDSCKDTDRCNAAMLYGFCLSNALERPEKEIILAWHLRHSR